MNITDSIAKAVHDYAPYYRNPYLADNKIDLILVLAGGKLACEWHLFSVPSKTTDAIKPIRVAERTRLEDLFQAAGVQFSHLGPAAMNIGDNDKPRHVTRIVYRIANSAENLELIEQVWTDPTGYPKDKSLHGKISGFPTTAIEAYEAGRNALQPTFEFPDHILKLPAYAFARFALSKAHWQDELKTPERWAEIIQQWAPDLYDHRLTQTATWVARAKASA